MFLLSALATACLLGLAGATASAATLTSTLTMDRDPMEEGWQRVASEGSHSVSGGTLRIDAPSYYEFMAPHAGWTDGLGSSVWTLEARLRRDPSSIGTPGIDIASGWFHIHLTFTGSGIQGRNFPSNFIGSYAVDTSVFHTYRLVGARESLAVFVDDRLAMSFDPVPNAGGIRLMFGDLGSSPTGLSISEWDYVSLTKKPAPIPLPAGVWLIGSGLLALGGVTWQRRMASA